MAPPTVVVVSIPVGLGGSVRSAVNLLTYLDGAARRVVVGPRTGRVVEVLAERRAFERYLPFVPTTGRFRNLGRLAAAARIAGWLLRHRRQVRAVHANGFGEMIITLPGAALARVPLVVWVHQFALPRSIARLAGLWRRLLARTTVRWAAVSPLAADLVVEAGLARAGEVAVVPNPIDPADVVAPVRTVDSEAVRVAYVGTPAVYKGFHLLPDIVEAVHRRVGDGPGVRWLVFSRQNGDDMAGTWDRLRAQERTLPVSLEGKTPDVAGIYARCDIVVVPSERESFCRVAAEAMANGLPVVGTDLEPVRALLGDDEAGLLVPVGDVEAIAGAVVRLAGDAGLRARLGAAGRARVAPFQPAAVRDAFLDLLGIGPSPGGPDAPAPAPGPAARSGTGPAPGPGMVAR